MEITTEATSLQGPVDLLSFLWGDAYVTKSDDQVVLMHFSRGRFGRIISILGRFYPELAKAKRLETDVLYSYPTEKMGRNSFRG